METQPGQRLGVAPKQAHIDPTPASTEGSGEVFNITIPPPTDQAAFDTSVRVQLDLKQ